MKKKINKACFFLFALSILLLVGATGEEVLTKLKVVTEQANIRLKPYIGSIIIKQVPQGTTLESTGKEGEWYSIRLKPDEADQVSGYVHESMVIVLGGPPIEKEEEVRTEEEEKDKIEQPKEIEEPEKIEEQIPPQPVVAKPPSRQPSKYKFELCFSDGGNIVYGGDLYKGAQGFADYQSDQLAIRGKGKVKRPLLSYILGGELAFPLSSRIYVGVGVDYFLRQKESQVIFEEGSFSETFTTRPKIEALPIRAFISYYVLPSFYIKGGIEYYFAKCSYFYRFQREEQQGEAEAQGLGILGGIGYELKLSSFFSFIVEATGRYAKIKGFKGKNTKIDSTGQEFIEEGKLYLYRIRTTGESSYPLLFIRENEPTEGDVFDVREAIIDFSGFSLKTGIKIKF